LKDITSADVKGYLDHVLGTTKPKTELIGDVNQIAQLNALIRGEAVDPNIHLLNLRAPVQKTYKDK
jgi:hypothetical protein